MVIAVLWLIGWLTELHHLLLHNKKADVSNWTIVNFANILQGIAVLFLQLVQDIIVFLRNSPKRCAIVSKPASKTHRHTNPINMRQLQHVRDVFENVVQQGLFQLGHLQQTECIHYCFMSLLWRDIDAVQSTFFQRSLQLQREANRLKRQRLQLHKETNDWRASVVKVIRSAFCAISGITVTNGNLLVFDFFTINMTSYVSSSYYS